MTDNSIQESPVKKTRPFAAKSFNYCFWAKLIVAIPALPLAAVAVSLFFVSPLAKLFAMAATVFFLVWGAVRIERMPRFSGKTRLR